MSPDKTTTLSHSNIQTIADLAKEFDFKHPIVKAHEEDLETEWLDENGDVTSQQDVEDDQQTVSEIKSEKTVRSWKESSTTRILIVGGALFAVALGLVSLFSLQMPQLNSTAVSKVDKNENPEEELMFAEDGDYAAQSAYAEQNAAFGELNKNIKGRPTSVESQPTQSKTPPSPSQASTQRTQTPRRSIPQRSYTTPPSPSRVAGPPRRSVIQIPKSIPRSTPPAPVPAPAPRRLATPAPRRLATPAPRRLATPAPRPVAAPAPRPAPSEPQLNPMEQWLLASGAGVTAYDVSASDSKFFVDDVDANILPSSTYEESLFGITLPIGSTLKARLDSPVVFSPDTESNQTVLIAVEATEYMPPAQLVATYSPASQSNSRKTVVQLTAKHFVVDGQIVPVNSKSILITGNKGKGLIAKQSRSGGGILSTMGKILLGGGQTALGELNRPSSQIISTGPLGTTQSTNFGDSDVLAGAGFGMAEQALNELESMNPSEPSLNGVWQMNPNQKLELHVLEDVFL